MFYGKGGYDYETVYYMPNWLRKFTYNEINKHYKAESEALEQAKNGKSVTPQPVAKGPQIRKPDFTVKPRK